MVRFYNISFIHSNRSFIYKVLLCCTWFLGLVLGYCFSFQISDIFASLMLSVADSRLSIVGLFFSLIFPFFISAVLLRYTSPLAILPLVFIKAFSFSLCACAVTFAFGDAGWLVRWLLIFSDSFLIVLLLWFWLKNISEEKRTIKTDLLLCIIASGLIGCADLCFVSPFLVMLFDH